MSSSALDEARSKVADDGGTLGEQLVLAGHVTDEDLTAFYKQRLLVPQVHPNVLARLPAKIVALIPSDMAIELRAIPVSLDTENNLTVAMSDPSDRHAVDQIGVYTGSYIVRAVATQMQIAWCLAHYYGHVTDLGSRLMQASTVTSQAAEETTPTPNERPPRVRGITGEVEAMRHKGLVPGEHASGQIAVDPALDPDDAAPEPAANETSDRARSVSGEIRMHRRAPSIKPPFPDDSGPVIIMEADTPPRGIEIGDDTAPARAIGPRRRMPAEPDPPELAARAGEVAQVDRSQREHAVADGPSIVIDDSLDREAVPAPLPESPESQTAPLRDTSGEIEIRDMRPQDGDGDGDAEDEAPALIRDAPKPIEDEPSAPILLDRRRAGELARVEQAAVVMKAPRTVGERRTSVGVGQPGPGNHVAKRAAPRDTAVEEMPAMLEDDVTREHMAAPDAGELDDATRLELRAAPPGDEISSDEHLAAPPSPVPEDDDSGPVVGPPAPRFSPAASGQIRLSGVIPRLDADDDDDDDSDVDHVEKRVDVRRRRSSPDANLRVTHPTMVMSAIELDEAIPDRTAEVVPAHLDHDDVDDGWGPPGTTIPPPLLGAIPGNDEPNIGMIPLPDLEHQPLIVSPPSPPEHGRPHTQTEAGVARMLEQATMRVLQLIQSLDHTSDRDEVVVTMITHLAESHRRAGFFAVRGGELSLFAILPRLAVMPAATLRLSGGSARASTLGDVVDTRLPYRGPMHDAASRTFLQSVLGACPAEILLVPIAVRDRVVGVLFGEHRLRHTFDDQLALAGRAAGNALERILKAKRG
ncbi:MAG TPA: hypothetical protein VH143_26580 [Kofleriaceae bacterium]|nr:hypothetical protein [Kofleriaceae bacterium]